MEANDDSSIKKITSLFSLFSGFIFIHKIDGIDIAMKNETSELNLSLSFDVADFFFTFQRSCITKCWRHRIEFWLRNSIDSLNNSFEFNFFGTKV